MSQHMTAALDAATGRACRWKQFVSLDNRYVAPIFITCILLVGHLSFGILESYQKTLLAIVVSIATELAAGPHFLSQVAASGQRVHQRHQRRHSGSLACLLAVRAVQRDLDHVEIRAARQRPPHLESIQLRHLGAAVSGPGDRGQLEHSVGQLSVADAGDLGAGLGDHLAPAALSHHRSRMSSSFIAFAFLRSWITGSPWQSEIAPITGPMYQLFIFFMITDPKTTVRSKKWQCVVVFLVALVEMILRMYQIVYAPFYALFIVGPTAMLIEMWLDSRRASCRETGGGAANHDSHVELAGQ